MKLSEERKAGLREVKECCKVSLPEFKDRYDNLDKIDKIILYCSILEDYDYCENEDEDKELNKDVIEFLRSDKTTAKIILTALQLDEPIKDDDGNEYDIHDDLKLYQKY